MAARETAIVFGVGPGLGWALAKRFVTESMQVGAVARDEAKLNSLIKSEGSRGVRPYAADVSNSEDVLRVFDSVDRDFGEPDLVVFNAGAFQKGKVLDIDPADFERCWRIGCLGGYLSPMTTFKSRRTEFPPQAWTLTLRFSAPRGVSLLRTASAPRQFRRASPPAGSAGL
jgi:NAD(P)-dependent dehydrogenase (short-subunit alcohol dehydrogenase family)